jgi:hypothetical protein
MACRRLGWIRPGAERRWRTRTRPRGGKGVGLAAMTLHAVSRSLRYDATARPGNSASAARRSGAGSPRLPARRALAAVTRSCVPLRMAVRLVRFHWWPALFTASTPPLTRARPRRLSRPQVTCAGGGIAVQPLSLGEGVAPEKMVREWERSKNRRPAARAEAGAGESL